MGELFRLLAERCWMTASVTTPLILLLHTLRCICDRTMEFVLPLYLTELFPGTLAPAATMSAVSTVGALFFGPLVASWYQRQQSFSRFSLLLAIENSAVILSLRMLSMSQTSSFIGAFGLACLCSTVDTTVQDVLQSVVTKHWAVLVAATKNKDSGQLSRLNSCLTGIDLGVGLAMPMVVAAFDEIDTGTLITKLAGMHIVSGVLIAAMARVLLQNIDLPSQSNQSDLTPPRKSGGNSNNCSRSLISGTDSALNQVRRLKKDTKVAISSMALLYFTVLAPSSGALTAWLRNKGTAVATIAMTRSLAQGMGWVGATLTPLFIVTFGENSMRIAQASQTTLLAGGVLSLFLLPGDTGRTLFLVLLALSRLGLWGFDLSQRETVQRDTDSDSRLLVFSVERTACQGFSFAMHLACIWLHRVDDFSILAAASFTATFLATALLWTGTGGGTSR